MLFYLSSYKLGNETTKLQELLKKTNGNIGYIPNSLDFTYADPIKRKESIEADMADLRQYGANVELIDLKNYFGKSNELEQKLDALGGVYVRGGNTFVLRQAMKISGFDTLLLKLLPRKDFLYIAYSAGVCALCPSLEPIAITDDSKDMPYSQITEQIWEGLNILPFAFEPHYKSDHPESASTDKEVEYCIENKILFQAYKDGEVLIMEK
jgi:dipeptidase E